MEYQLRSPVEKAGKKVGSLTNGLKGIGVNHQSAGKKVWGKEGHERILGNRGKVHTSKVDVIKKKFWC